MKKVYLYGAGGYGRDLLSIFEKNDALDLITAIIDNSPGLQKSVLYGKTIKSYDEMKADIDSESTIIISVVLETALSISKQLKKDGIIRYIYWAYEKNTPFNKLIELLHNDNSYYIFSHSLQQELTKNKVLEFIY